MALTHYPAHFEERRGCGLDDLEIRDSWNGNWNHNTVCDNGPVRLKPLGPIIVLLCNALCLN